ncbi:hypothetical protein VNO78_08326 [Psophocarpus tetragonolobus]|uniref:Uncharacterized protein n=1 Tax=Psophocarpus tetragonolobus TaxID=3891 RepID=A0AAN9SWZ7_PSOTE
MPFGISVVFENIQPVMSTTIAAKARARSEEIRNTSPPTSAQQMEEHRACLKPTISRTPSPFGAYKLNVDDVINNGKISSVAGELWAIYHELKLVKDTELSQHIYVESDSRVAIHFFPDGCSRNHACYSLWEGMTSIYEEVYSSRVHIFSVTN